MEEVTFCRRPGRPRTDEFVILAVSVRGAKGESEDRGNTEGYRRHCLTGPLDPRSWDLRPAAASDN
jgi:hypothetical protein